MEGARAVDSILYSIDVLDKWTEGFLDAIVIARGGGSEQSLAVFNDYRICQRICLATRPVLTAIGHEKDLSAAEICSHLTPSPSTPSGLGKFLQDRFSGLHSSLADRVGQLVQGSAIIHNRELERLNGMIRQVPDRAHRSMLLQRERLSSGIRQFGQSAEFLVREQEQTVLQQCGSAVNRMKLKNMQEQRSFRKHVSRFDFKKRFRENSRIQNLIAETLRGLGERVQRLFHFREEELCARRELAKARDPDQVLKQGFSLVLDRKKRIVPSLKEFKKLSTARLRFFDGESDVTRKEEQ
jgi:exonuclease VII large subunit